MRWITLITLVCFLFAALPSFTACQTSISEEEIEELQNTITQLQSEIAELKQQNAEFEEQLAEKDARISQAQELYDFVTKALGEWETMRRIDNELLTLYNTLIGEGSLGDSEVNKVISILQQVEQNLKWLYAPPGAVKIKDSLLRQSDLTNSYFSNIMTAWANSSNQDTFMKYISEAHELCSEIGPVSKENERNLINLQLQAEHDLKR